MTKKRLSKFLSQSGIASRRACETLIFDGLVEVNGQVIVLPQTLVDENDTIIVKGKKVGPIESKVYYMLHKPAGYICSAKKSKNSHIVLDLFGEEDKRLFTVGRLDKDTEGLLLVTNDGHFANQVIHPSFNLHKEYLAKTDHEIGPEHLIAISSGTLVEGVFVKPVKVSKVRKSTLKIMISEGKKREVRMLLKAAGLDVQSLRRIRIGGLQLGTLAIGQFRPITPRERQLIFEG